MRLPTRKKPARGRPNRSTAPRIAEALRAGRVVTDLEFDALLPRQPRTRSGSFWTPVNVAVLASQWFKQHGVSRLLDVGAGPGKLCSIASLLLDQRVFGIEQRPSLCASARKLARALGAEVEILDGTFDQVTASEFDAFYFYNPFEEQVAGASDRYDRRVVFSDQRYFEDLKIVEAWLNAAPIGTAMATYHGLGGRIPASWTVQREQRMGADLLRLWVKREATATEFYVELNDRLQTGTQLRALLSELKVTEEDSPLLTRLAGFH
jgi:SAM-dependent methyltransferase